MPFASERELIESYVQENYSRTPVKYDNIPFNQPGDNAFIALSILSGAAANIDIGGYTQRHNGVIQVDIYVKENTGTREAREIAGDLRDLFTNQQISDEGTTIHCRVASLNRVAKAPAGRYRISVSIPYTLDIYNA